MSNRTRLTRFTGTVAACAMLASVRAATLEGKPVRAPVGQLLAVSGRVEMHGEHGKPKACASYQQVRQGDTLKLGPNGRATLVLYRTAKRMALAAGSAVLITRFDVRTITGRAPVPQAALSRAALRVIATPPAAGHRFLGTIVRANKDLERGPRHPRPIGGMDWTQQAVSLRWDGPIVGRDGQEKGLSLHARVRESDTGRTVLDRSLPSSARTLVLPAGAIRPGRWYLWEVVLLGPDGADVACGGRLRVLTRQEQSDLRRLEREMAGLREADPADATPDLVLGRAYEAAGVWDEALDHYESAQRMGADTKSDRVRVRKALGGIP